MRGKYNWEAEKAKTLLYFLSVAITSALNLLHLSKQDKQRYCRMNEICSRINAVTLEAGVVELADAPDSKSGEGNLVWVRFPPPACFLPL